MMKRDMKEILDRVLNHEELTREETKRHTDRHHPLGIPG